MKGIFAAFVAVFLSGCASSGAVTDTSCKSFKPINGSVQDTPDTKRQVLKHNRAFDAICKS